MLIRHHLSAVLTGASLMIAGSVQALTLTIDSLDPFAAQSAFIGTLKTATVEDFEGFSSLTFGDPISTSVGEFHGTGSDGTGACTSISAGGICDELVVLNQADSPFSGRYDTSDGNGQDGNEGKWLDSNDISEVTWNIDTGVNFDAFGFMLMDPSDVGATLTIELLDGTTVSEIINFKQTSGTLFYVSAVLDDLATSATLTLTNSGGSITNDGFGIDDVAVGVVPEPLTLALLGIGLVGLGFGQRRKS